MLLLFIVSLIWAFSFGLIKGRLAGIDPTIVAALRLILALAVFVPFYRPRSVSWKTQVRLALIGALQFGVMYLLYLRSYLHLQAFEVALFTITTPFFITLLDSTAERRIVGRHAVAALLAVAGAGVIVWQRLTTRDMLVGIGLVQLSNICFAAGQIAWRRARKAIPASTTDAALFATLYAGAAIAAVSWSAATSDWSKLHLDGSQVATIAYLGVLASGVCFFWWNIGATRVNAGTLAAFNNAKIPLAVACSLAFFGEHANLPRLMAGGALMALGVWIAERKPQTTIARR